jgi:pantetheine-phosphate adenylyltransferase
MKQVEVDSFDGLLVNYAKKRNATAVLRGLRAISDFEYEFALALTNRKLNDTLETVFLMPSERYTYLNSTIVREIARLGGDVSDFVPPIVKKAFDKKYKTRR